VTKTFWRKQGNSLVPSERNAEAQLAKWREGEVVGGKMTRPRNLRFHNLAHAIGGLVAENLDDFEGMDAHRVLKRLQIESCIGCDEMGVRSGGQMILYRIPQSLSFESMGEDKCHEVVSGLCSHLTRHYWPDTTVEEILQMAQEFERQ
jgi:hypothetical protein